MSRDEQIELTTAISNGIRDMLIAKINAGKIPENWDGHELRDWLAAQHEANRSDAMRMPRSRRRKEFVNDCLVNCL